MGHRGSRGIALPFLTACTEPQWLYKGALYLTFYITKCNHYCERKHVNFSLRNSVFQNKLVRIIFSVIMMGIKLQICEKYLQNFERKNCRTTKLKNTRGRQE